MFLYKVLCISYIMNIHLHLVESRAGVDPGFGGCSGVRILLFGDPQT